MISAPHAASDTCLILDVARFKYPPHWVSISGLWASMKRIDPETGRERGYALLTRTTHVLWRADGERGRAVPREVRPQEPALTLRFRGYTWTSLAAALRGTRDALAAGQSVVVDRMHLDPEQRAHFVGVARERSVPVHALVLHVPTVELMRRVHDSR